MRAMGALHGKVCDPKKKRQAVRRHGGVAVGPGDTAGQDVDSLTRAALRSVTDARRRLLAVSVDFEVLANSAENAGQLQETVKGADFSDVADSLEVSGVTCTFAGVEVYNSQRFLSLSTSFFVCACWSDKFYCDR